MVFSSVVTSIFLPLVLNACQFAALSANSGLTSVQANGCPPAPIHAFRVDYTNYATSRSVVGPLETQMKTAGINLVGVGAGRAEWAYFKWAGHEANWASDVRDTGIDFLAEDTARFSQWAQVNAVVDVLAPSYIRAHPEAAAVSFTGQPSTDFISTHELVYGVYGQQLLDMIGYIAANYPVDSISVTELFYYSDGYGADDKALYMAYSGNTDWPRLPNGVINRDDVTLGNWRTHMLDIWLDKAVAVSHQYGKQFFVDVKLSLDNLNRCSNECGTDYHVVLQHSDRLIVWAYYDLDDISMTYLTTIAQFLESSFGSDKVILSLGLWDDIYPVTPPGALSQAMAAVQAEGMPNVWVTPNVLMTPQHWQALTAAWGTP